MSKLRAACRFIWRLAGSLRNLSPDRHPLGATLVISGAGAVAGFLVIILVIVPLVTGVAQVPAQFGHDYEDYWHGVGQQFQQACEQTHGPDCQQFLQGAP